MAQWRITLVVDADDRLEQLLLLRWLIWLYSALRDQGAEVSVKVERVCNDQ